MKTVFALVVSFNVAFFLVGLLNQSLKNQEIICQEHPNDCY